jgi:hypothetical protein
MPALSAVVFLSLITIRCFQMPAPKAENGFVTGRIVSSPKPDETFSRKSGDFNRGQPIERRRSGFPIGQPEIQNRSRRDESSRSLGQSRSFNGRSSEKPARLGGCEPKHRCGRLNPTTYGALQHLPVVT